LTHFTKVRASSCQIENSTRSIISRFRAGEVKGFCCLGFEHSLGWLVLEGLSQSGLKCRLGLWEGSACQLGQQLFRKAALLRSSAAPSKTKF